MKYKITIGIDHFCGSYRYRGEAYAVWNRDAEPKLWKTKKGAEKYIQNFIKTINGDHEGKEDLIEIVEVDE